MTEAITIHTDGACSGNPGPGGFAAIVEWDPWSPITVSGGDPDTTNNRMELSAVIEALRVVNDILIGRGWRAGGEDDEPTPAGQPTPHADPVEITVRSDSKYITDAFNEGWIRKWQVNGWRSSKGAVVSPQLWKDLLQEMQGHPVSWVWVKGHSGDPMNERCDRLAVLQAQAARSQHGYWVSAGNPMRGEPEVVAVAMAASDAAVAATAAGVPGTRIPTDETPNTQAPGAPGGDVDEEYSPGCDSNCNPQWCEDHHNDCHVSYQAGYADGYQRGRTVAQGQETHTQDTERNTAHVSGYEACRQELFQFLSNLTSGPPPSFGDYVSGYNDCRKELLDFYYRMKYNDLPF